MCSQGEYKKVFERLHALPNEVQHLIIQLGNTTSRVVVISSRADYGHRDSDCVSPHGVSGIHISIEIESSRHIREDGFFGLKRVCEPI